MKNSVKYHERVLKIMEEALKTKSNKIEELKKLLIDAKWEYGSLLLEMDKLKTQIISAKKSKMFSFDPDIYNPVELSIPIRNEISESNE